MPAKHLGRWTPKLTDESRLYALQRMAVGTRLKDVVSELKEKFGIEISPVRLSLLKNNLRYLGQFKAMQTEFYSKLGKLATTEITFQENRVKRAQGLLDRLYAKVEELGKSDDPKVLKGGIKDLCELSKVIVAVLKYAKEELHVDETRSSGGKPTSFLQKIEINTTNPSIETNTTKTIDITPEVVKTETSKEI
jgi:hypothetical protein